MNTHSLRLLVATVAAAIAGTAANAGEHRIDLQEVGVDGRLTIAGVSGDIEIVGTDEPVIVIRSEDFDGEEEQFESRPDGMRSLLASGADDTGLGFGIKREGKNVVLTPSRPHVEADYELQVPRQMSVKLAGVLRGDVHASNIGGELEVVATDGDISLETISGPVVVQAVNGEVKVAFSVFPKEAPSSVNSVNGAVTLVLPADAQASLELMTVNGDIRTDLPIEVKEKQIVPYGGPRTVKGTLNGGGATLKVNSINDGIFIRSNSGTPKPEK